jgi:hypothetical protein
MWDKILEFGKELLTLKGQVECSAQNGESLSFQQQFSKHKNKAR